MRARAWDPVKLSVKWWDNDLPSQGDGLQTASGRRYLILGLKFSRDGRTLRALQCLVLPPEEPIEGKIFSWEWAPRRRKAFGTRA